MVLAEIVGISRSAISQYENGEQTPSPAVLHGIACALNLPVAFFLAPGGRMNLSVFYRSFRDATKASRIRAEQRLTWAREILTVLSSFVTLPEIVRPPGVNSIDFQELSMEGVEQLALETRRKWGLGDGPITNMVSLLENHGFIVLHHFLDSGRLDAFSVHEDEACRFPTIVLGTDKGCAVRSRFNLAHEVAHLLLHKSVRDVPKHLKLIESQANRFAGAFLLPADAFRHEVKAVTLEHLILLKARWGVSVGTMIHRLADLGVLPSEQAQILYKRRTKRGWTKFEPLDDKIQQEQPMLLQRCIDVILNHSTSLRDIVLRSLHWNTREIEELIGLRADTFSTCDAFAEPKIIRFPC